jgi:DNA-binding transcriptional ArsR family regulator
MNQITELMHLARPSISHHLKVLKDAGMVNLTRESRENFYSLLWDEPTQPPCAYLRRGCHIIGIKYEILRNYVALLPR